MVKGSKKTKGKKKKTQTPLHSLSQYYIEFSSFQISFKDLDTQISLKCTGT